MSSASSQHSLEDRRHNSRKFILLKDAQAKSRRGVNSTTKPRLPSKHEEQRMLRGSLWEERECGALGSPASSLSSFGSGSKSSSLTPGVAPISPRKHELDSIELDDVKLSCPDSIVAELTDDLCRLFLAIPDCEERFKFFSDVDRLKYATYIRVNSRVMVCTRRLSPCKGIIRWKGRLEQRQGVWFGVEIEVRLVGSGLRLSLHS